MHCIEVLQRINIEWPHPLTYRERKAAAREAALADLEARLGIAVDRDDPMAGAMAQLEMALMAKCRR